MNPTQLAIAQLISRLGFDLALLTLKSLSSVTTLDDAIAKLEKITTSEEYVKADAEARGVPPVPLPTP